MNTTEKTCQKLINLGFCNTSLTEANKLLQVKNIKSLEQKILEQINELKEKDEQIEALRSEVEYEKMAG